MSIQPICDRCKKELIAFGAILLSPPNKDGHCKKFHLCKKCYERIKDEIRIFSSNIQPY